MKATICTLLFCLCRLSLIAQERYRADSLLQVLDRSTGKQRVEILRHLSRAYNGGNKELALKYAFEALKCAEELGVDTFIVRSLNNLASAYQNSGDRRSSLPYLERAIAITRSNGNQAQLLECLEFLGTAYAGMHQTDKALPLSEEALSISEKLKDSVGILNAMEIIAASHKELHQFDKAVEVYRQEMALLEWLPFRRFEKGRACVNLGELMDRLGKEEDALALFEKGRMAFVEMGYLSGALVARLDEATLLLDHDRLSDAEKSFKAVLDMNKDIQDPEINALCLNGLGVIAMQNKHFELAESYYHKAENEAKSAGLNAVLKNLYGYMTDLFCLQGDYEVAKKYKKLATDYADSVLTADVRDRLSEMQVQYETAEKELKISEQQSQIFRSNAVNYGLGGSLLAFALLAWLFYNRFRLRKKAELDAAVIREQQLGLNAVIEAQDAERKRIAKDLHDGIAQELVALKLGFDAFGRKMAKIAPGETTQFAELNGQLDATCTELRGIAHTMSPPSLELHGLAPSLELLLRNVMSNIGVEASLNAHDLPVDLDEKTKVGIYRITQELLNNIVKHARAARVMIELYSSDSNLVLRVEDDGIGFNFEEVKLKGSMGILNVLSRTNALGGMFFTEPRLPKGTVALVRVPL